MRPALPRLWLMTDERSGAALLTAVARLPRGAGVVFRHHATAPAERRRLFGAARRIARARRLVLLLADHAARAKAWGADGAHGRSAQRPGHSNGIRSAPAHDRAELVRAIRSGADLIFVSPIFATRSHPGGRALGRLRLGLMLHGQRRLPPIVALGGMDARRFRGLRALGIYGWAGIDALMPASGSGPIRT